MTEAINRRYQLILVSGSGAGLVGAKQSKEFKYMKKADLVKKDKPLAQLFQDSENGKAPYKLPFRAVDGSYNGCTKCNVAGLTSYDGSSNHAATTTATTKSPSAATTVAATTEFPHDDSTEEFDDAEM